MPDIPSGRPGEASPGAPLEANGLPYGSHPPGGMGSLPPEVAIAFTNRVMAWQYRIESQGSSPKLLAEIDPELAAAEKEHPGNPVWDAIRAQLAKRFLDKGYLQSSVQMIQNMQSPRAMAQTVFQMTRGDAARHAEEVRNGLISHLRHEPDNGRLAGFAQALADEFIRTDPFSPSLDFLEGVLAEATPHRSSLQTWADSQKELWPQANWPALVAFIENESHWQDTPLRYRQHATCRHVAMQYAVVEDPGPELVDLIIEELNASQEHYPTAPVWDEFKLTLGVLLLDHDHAAAALEIGRHINQYDAQWQLVSHMLDTGNGTQAMQLTEAITDAKAMAETLLSGIWPNDSGQIRLWDIIEGNDHTRQRRLDCLVVVRETLARQGDEAAVGICDNLIASLETSAGE